MTEFGGVLDHANQAAENLRPIIALDLLAPELRDLRSLVKILRIIDDDLAGRMVPLLANHVSVEVEGVGILQAKKGGERKGWDHEGLIRVVTAMGRDERRIDKESGEPLESEADAIVRALVECAGIRDWRTTKLRARGIDPDEFCSVTWGPAKVVGI